MSSLLTTMQSWMGGDFCKWNVPEVSAVTSEHQNSLQCFCPDLVSEVSQGFTSLLSRRSPAYSSNYLLTQRITILKVLYSVFSSRRPVINNRRTPFTHFHLQGESHIKDSNTLCLWGLRQHIANKSKNKTVIIYWKRKAHTYLHTYCTNALVLRHPYKYPGRNITG